MTIPRAVHVSVLVAATVTLGEACSSGGSGSSGGTPDLDASPDESSPATDASADAQVTDATVTDAPVDSKLPVPISACAPPVRVDTLGLVAPYVVTAASQGDKWIAVWPTSAGAGQHLVARSFNGVALGTEMDLVLGPGNSALVSDGAGRAFLQGSNGPQIQRQIYDFAADSWGPATSVAWYNSPDFTNSISPLPGGGAISVYRAVTTTNPRVVADRWSPSSPSWTRTPLDGEPTASRGLRALTNASGKIAALWLSTVGEDASAITSARFDGTAWSAPTTQGVSVAIYSMYRLEAAVLSNGDVLVVWPRNDLSIAAGRFVAASNSFVPSADIGAAGLPTLRVDNMDRATVAWLTGGNVVARRDAGAAAASAEETLGPADGFRLDVEPETGTTVVLSQKGTTLSLRSALPGTSWTAPIPLAGVTASGSAATDARLVFDGAGRPTVFLTQDGPVADDRRLFFVRCK